MAASAAVMLRHGASAATATCRASNLLNPRLQPEQAEAAQHNLGRATCSHALTLSCGLHLSIPRQSWTMSAQRGDAGAVCLYTVLERKHEHAVKGESFDRVSSPTLSSTEERQPQRSSSPRREIWKTKRKLALICLTSYAPRLRTVHPLAIAPNPRTHFPRQSSGASCPSDPMLRSLVAAGSSVVHRMPRLHASATTCSPSQYSSRQSAHSSRAPIGT